MLLSILFFLIKTSLSVELVAFHSSKKTNYKNYDYSHLTTLAVWGNPEVEFENDLVSYAHAQNTSVHWMIGDGFVNRHTLHEKNYRDERIVKLIEICDKYNLDGINIDVEAPIYRPIEKQGVLDFTKELFLQLKSKNRSLTWDVPVNPDQLDCLNGRCLYWKEMAKFVDYYYVMGYDAQTIPYKTQVTDPLQALQNGYSEWLQIVKNDSKKLVALIPWYACRFKCHFRMPHKSSDRCYTNLLTDM